MAERDPIELHDGSAHQPVVVEDAKPIVDAAKKKKRVKVLLALAAAKVVIGGGWYLLHDTSHVSTDNAYVQADSAQVTPLVSAAVIDAPVVNTQVVRKGQILLRLDDSDARLALARVEADYAKARRQFLPLCRLLAEACKEDLRAERQQVKRSEHRSGNDHP